MISVETTQAGPSPVRVAYFSNVSQYTHRFASKLGFDSQRIPLRGSEPGLEMSEPYVLIVPTYGGCSDVTGSSSASVPKQVVRFLNNTLNRSLLRGVIASGNTNFGPTFGIAGDIISAKCGVPYLYRFELMGTSEDVENVQNGLEQLWQQL